MNWRLLFGYLFIIAVFVIAACICAVITPLVYMAGARQYADNMLRSMSRTFAALCGYSGRYSMSAECGMRLNEFSKLVDFLLGKGHCESQARIEGLIR